MNEEIDIIELLKRVKEGKAPKWIEVGGNKYKYYGEGYSIEYLYIDNDGDGWVRLGDVDVCTKIKILDKPIIEEFKISEEHTEELYMDYPSKDEIIGKINEIIKHINKEEK